MTPDTYLEAYERLDKRLWRTREGKLVHLTKMDPLHLENLLGYLTTRVQQLEEELELRQWVEAVRDEDEETVRFFKAWLDAVDQEVLRRGDWRWK